VFAPVVLMFLTGTATLGFAQMSKQSADESEIRKSDAAWSQAAESKDLDKFVSFYADDASALPFNAPIAHGKVQIRQLWSQLMSKPGFGLSFTPTNVEVSKSGDMAYEIGTFQLKLNDPQGNATTTPGKYVVVWKKQPTHNWKAVADVFNTDK
jgi:ketosteroid isomerase-like protein